MHYIDVDEPPMVLGLIMDVLDAVESGQPLDAALGLLDATFSSVVDADPRRYIAHAVDTYLTATADRPPLLPHRHIWAIQHESDIIRELWSWGRRYQSADGSRRELRLLRAKSPDPARRTKAEVAVAAYVTAFGSAARKGEYWDKPFELYDGPTPEQVTVLEIGLFDGSREILFDGTAAQARDKYQAEGRQKVPILLNGSGVQTGGDCPKCRLKAACPAVARAGDLLGVVARPRTPLRKVSVSDLRYYERCPARYRLQSMWLPQINEYDRYARLGKAVHKVLERRHAAATGPCSAANMPEGDAWAKWDLDEREVRAGVKMLANHALVCPLHTGTGLRVEPTLAFHDTSAQAMVIATPDLVYQDRGAWVWRETKTTQRPTSTRPLLDLYPQLALATTVLAAGLLGGEVSRARIELEVLRPESSDLVPFDPNEPANLAQAREVLRKLAQPWRDDTDFPARPGENCRTCPVRRWCPSAVAPE
ncbi:PD-(D/E)XK nuclease family protein [Micromonospora parva]|uniref:PD-(D/E)XK nuclease family protein n=1 Tax=Micromonospora parva TaxID=1464048 RepID=A0ABW6VNZ2_9ACTN|nr:PD-(D/E)XK nuclease family protein [Micromonospora parva]